MIKRCALCGTSVVAENKSGEWVPETHGPPTQRVCKGAGHKRVVGKALIVRRATSQPARFKSKKKPAANKRGSYKK